MKQQLSVGLLTLGLSVLASQASNFDFSYTYADGNVVAGTFSGQVNGIYVDNISNLAMSFNGHATAGHVYAATYGGGTFAPGPVVSFVAADNNFIFINSDILHGDFGFTDALFFAPPAYFGTPTIQVDSSSPFFAETKAIVPGNWRLHVPEAGSTLALSGIAFSALCLARRKFSAR